MEEACEHWPSWDMYCRPAWSHGHSALKGIWRVILHVMASEFAKECHQVKFVVCHMTYSRGLGQRTLWYGFHSYLNIHQKSLMQMVQSDMKSSAGTADTEKGLGDYTELYCSCESHTDQTYTHRLAVSRGLMVRAGARGSAFSLPGFLRLITFGKQAHIPLSFLCISVFLLQL